MLILVLLLLLALLRCAYLETVVRRLAADRNRLLLAARRSTTELQAVLAYNAETTTAVAEGMAANLRPVGNVDLVTSNVVTFPGREERSAFGRGDE